MRSVGAMAATDQTKPGQQGGPSFFSGKSDSDESDNDNTPGRTPGTPGRTPGFSDRDWDDEADPFRSGPDDEPNALSPVATSVATPVETPVATPAAADGSWAAWLDPAAEQVRVASTSRLWISPKKPTGDITKLYENPHPVPSTLVRGGTVATRFRSDDDDGNWVRVRCNSDDNEAQAGWMLRTDLVQLLSTRPVVIDVRFPKTPSLEINSPQSPFTQLLAYWGDMQPMPLDRTWATHKNVPEGALCNVVYTGNFIDLPFKPRQDDRTRESYDKIVLIRVQDTDTYESWFMPVSLRVAQYNDWSKETKILSHLCFATTQKKMVTTEWAQSQFKKRDGNSRDTFGNPQVSGGINVWRSNPVPSSRDVWLWSAATSVMIVGYTSLVSTRLSTSAGLEPQPLQVRTHTVSPWYRRAMESPIEVGGMGVVSAEVGALMLGHGLFVQTIWRNIERIPQVGHGRRQALQRCIQAGLALSATFFSKDQKVLLPAASPAALYQGEKRGSFKISIDLLLGETYMVPNGSGTLVEAKLAEMKIDKKAKTCNIKFQPLSRRHEYAYNPIFVPCDITSDTGPKLMLKRAALTTNDKITPSFIDWDAAPTIANCLAFDIPTGGGAAASDADDDIGSNVDQTWYNYASHNINTDAHVVAANLAKTNLDKLHYGINAIRSVAADASGELRPSWERLNAWCCAYELVKAIPTTTPLFDVDLVKIWDKCIVGLKTDRFALLDRVSHSVYCVAERAIKTNAELDENEAEKLILALWSNGSPVNRWNVSLKTKISTNEEIRDTFRTKYGREVSTRLDKVLASAGAGFGMFTVPFTLGQRYPRVTRTVYICFSVYEHFMTTEKGMNLSAVLLLPGLPAVAGTVRQLYETNPWRAVLYLVIILFDFLWCYPYSRTLLQSLWEEATGTQLTNSTCAWDDEGHAQSVGGRLHVNNLYEALVDIFCNDILGGEIESSDGSEYYGPAVRGTEYAGDWVLAISENVGELVMNHLNKAVGLVVCIALVLGFYAMCCRKSTPQESAREKSDAREKSE